MLRALVIALVGYAVLALGNTVDAANPRVSSRDAALGDMSQAVSQQYTITGRVRSRTSPASESIFFSGT